MEYVIWGIEPNGKEETLLLTLFDNSKIIDKDVAMNLASLLTIKGCKKVRIQKLDFSKKRISIIDFKKVVNLN